MNTTLKKKSHRQKTARGKLARSIEGRMRVTHPYAHIFASFAIATLQASRVCGAVQGIYPLLAWNQWPAGVCVDELIT